MSDHRPHAAAVPATAGALLNDYLTEQQLAEQLDVTIRTLRKWRSLGEAPPETRLGKRIYYSRRSALSWIQARQSEAA